MGETADDLVMKSPREVAERVLALIVVVRTVHNPDGTMSWMRTHSLERYLSANEARFVAQDDPSHESQVEFSWRAEAVVSLLWALSGLAEMPKMDQEFSVFESEMIGEAIENPETFLSTAKLRPAEELNEMEQFLYHQHWRVRDYQLFPKRQRDPLSDGEQPIEELNPEIVYERRYGMSWLVGWGRDWDNVPTDT